jgi:hypothetical protein
VGPDSGTGVPRPAWCVGEVDEGGAEYEAGGVGDRVMLERGDDRTVKLDVVAGLGVGPNLVDKASGTAAAWLKPAIPLQHHGYQRVTKSAVHTHAPVCPRKRPQLRPIPTQR